MERPARPAVEHLKEVAWATFLLDLVFLLLALLFLPHFGAALTLVVFGTLAAVSTAVIGGIALLNVLLIAMLERWERRRGQAGPPRPAPLPATGAREHVEVVLDPRSFARSATGGISGGIWLRHAPRGGSPRAFPGPDWTDFPVVILGWWLVALRHTAAPAACLFMDGPYRFELTPAGGALLRVRCLENRIAGDVVLAELTTPAITLQGAVQDAALAALAECDRRGWTGADVEALRRACGTGHSPGPEQIQPIPDAAPG